MVAHARGVNPRRASVFAHAIPCLEFADMLETYFTPIRFQGQKFSQSCNSMAGRLPVGRVRRNQLRARQYMIKGSIPIARATASRCGNLFFRVAILLLIICAAPQTLRSQSSPRAAPADDSTTKLQNAPSQSAADAYVGSEPCAKCHAAIYESYSHTAMANASGPASQGVIAGNFEHKPSGVNYQVSADNGHVWLSFERPGDPTLKGKRELLYFIGSGGRGRSYLFSADGFLFESPINWYGQRRVWDMAPAYQQAREMPMNLPALPGCLSCHTSGLQPPLPGTQNKYPSPTFAHSGITCERCHGAGKLHSMNAGPIVNPAKLAPERRDEVCMQCHLEGNVAIEQPGRHLYEFEPGKNLSDFIRYFVYTGDDRRGMGALSQVQALAQSVCKKKTGDAMWCVTCHDPHSTPAAAQKVEYYRAKCVACHGDSFADKHHPTERDCTQCHMARAASSDVAHTQVTDHRILRVPEMQLEDLKASRDRDLVPFPPGSPDPRDLALAWQSVAANGTEAELAKARSLLEDAVRQTPNDAVLLAALGYIEQQKGALDRAREHYERALALDPAAIDAATNLGVMNAKSGDLTSAVALWKRAFENSPGTSRIGMNIAFAYCAAGKFDDARTYVRRVLEFNPDLGVAKKLDERLAANPPSCSLK
jgi:predicted CXXCH cytochrome family protein